MTLTVLVVIAVIIMGSPAPAAGASEDNPPAAVTTAFETVALAHYAVTSTSCGFLSNSNGQRFPGCVHADGAVRRPTRVHERVEAAFRGTVTLLLAEPIDAVYISYGRRPATEYRSATVVWPLPGSGTYDMTVTVKWHDEFTRNETTYLVPLWVPRR